MRLYLLASCLVTLPLFASPAWAGVNGRNRMHKVEKIEKRLATKTKENALAVGEYWSPDGAGTASLVQRSADGKHGLLLTNFHVAPKMPTDSQIKFGKATAKITRWLAGSERLDYALLHVKFENADAPTPVTLMRRAPAYREKLYTVGFPGISSLYLVLDEGPESGTFTDFDKTAIDIELDREPGRVRTINVGHEIGGGRIRNIVDPDPRRDHREVVPRTTFTTNLQSIPGSSGSPVFSAKDQRVLGLIWGGGRSHKQRDTHWNDAKWRWTEGGLSVPSLHILGDITRKNTKSAFAEHKAAVDELLLRAED